MESCAASPSRVVLLGASNVERCIATAVRVSGSRIAGPLEYYLACGHGRSYGMESSVLGRRLPGIANCGLWDALPSDDSAETYAFVTDVGNDLLYGAPVDRIAGWVQACLELLAERNARIVIAGVPTTVLETLPRWRFELLSRILFPFSGARYDETLASAFALDGALRALADRYRATWCSPRATWYGFDPIHIRGRVWEEAWSEFFSPWGKNFSRPRASTFATFKRWSYLKRLRAERYHRWGRARGAKQPAGMLEDGTRLWVY